MAQSEQNTAGPVEVDEVDEVDEWDQRIDKTGCAEQNATLNTCFFEKKDWRACQMEMNAFKECWKRQGNTSRTDTKDN